MRYRSYQPECRLSDTPANKGLPRSWKVRAAREFLRCSLVLALLCCGFASRPLRDDDVTDRDSEPVNWEDELPVPALRENGELAPSRQFPANISGTYRGTWQVEGGNTSMRFPDLHKDSGNIIFQLRTTPTGEQEVHYVHGEVVLRDGLYISDGDVNLRLEGVYVRPFGELRMILSGSAGLEPLDGEEPALGDAYNLVLHDPRMENGRRGHRKPGVGEMAEACKIRMVAQVAPAAWDWPSGVQEHVATEMQGLVESAREVEGGHCFAALRVNVTAVNLEAYYTKAVNYTLMVTFMSFLQVLFLIRQMEHSNTQSGAAKVSLLMIGQQAIMDAYLCLLHLTAGIVVESLFNAFATAAFFKFVLFSIFEMRYLLAIWKARRPASAGEGWETLRRELSILYSRFYGFLLGGILLMYQLHGLLRYLLLLFYSFWVPQIVTSVIRDSRKPLHPHYIVGTTLTRLAIPLYTFGCPKNFMRVEPSPGWCLALLAFLGAQAGLLLLQHSYGARCFIPRQFLPDKYSYFRRAERSGAAVGGEEGSGVDCVICMTPVPTSPRSAQRMVTPCDHVFHTGCLQRWMDIKMECPTCRRTLPPL